MNWQGIVAHLRAQVVELSHHAKAAHLASSLSCIDILAVLYESVLRLKDDDPNWPNRDRFILSKGHAAAALYAVLARKHILTNDQLRSYGQEGSLLEEHPSPRLDGVEAATGSLGHGLSIGNGIALGSRIQGQGFKVYVLLSDGECNEGSTWEAALFASRHQLSNLCAIVDYNKWQATGRSQEVLALDPLAEKWRAFGWDVDEVDGHDHEQLEAKLRAHSEKGPRMIVAHTVKGKGISFMEDDNNWHYRIPTSEEVQLAKVELGVR
jgi:transketolase